MVISKCKWGLVAIQGGQQIQRITFPLENQRKAMISNKCTSSGRVH